MNVAELRFRDVCLSRGFSVLKSDDLSDMHEHWDFKVNNSLVDVKGLKRVSRNDKSYSTHLTWVEFVNVRGNKGWLQCCADYIAFEQINYFLIVSRQDLLDYCNKYVVDEFVTSSKEAYYKKYSRKNRQDIISLINLVKLKEHVKTWKLKF